MIKILISSSIKCAKDSAGRDGWHALDFIQNKWRKAICSQLDYLCSRWSLVGRFFRKERFFGEWEWHDDFSIYLWLVDHQPKQSEIAEWHVLDRAWVREPRAWARLLDLERIHAWASEIQSFRGREVKRAIQAPATVFLLSRTLAAVKVDSLQK